MSNADLNTALYEKMAAEQDNYRDWLKKLTPDQILDHAYEYSIREDIMVLVEDLELTDAQATALLDSQSPLADVYEEFGKLDTGYMDVIRESIEERADDLCRQQEELSAVPLYRQTGAYAREHDELPLYRDSHKANIACKKAIENAISRNYVDNRLGDGAVSQVVGQFGMERVIYVLANTIQQKHWDQRFSPENREWAETVPVTPRRDFTDYDRNVEFVVERSHPGLVNLFVKQARKLEQEQTKDSVLQKLKKEPSARKAAAPAPKKREPER